MSLLDRILGKPLASSKAEEEKIGPVRGVAILGLDGLASSAYGPEAALTMLLPLGALSVAYIAPLLGAILLLLGILYFSYRQTIPAYPSGGGSYTVSRENLGTRAGLLAASALLTDYILNAAVAISTGVGALISAFPLLHDHTLALCLAILAVITIMNLRGVRESGVVFAIPTYAFVALMGLTLAVGVARTLLADGHPSPVSPPAPLEAPAVQGAGLWLLLRAFANGCTAMTGVEAVSNGVQAFRQPAPKNAQRTLTLIVIILATLLAGIGFLARAYGIGAMQQEKAGYQSVLSQLVGAVFGRGPMYYATIGSILILVCLSANTSFAGFPRVCQVMAQDRFLPNAFTTRGRRLVNTIGILFLAVLAAALLIAFNGITEHLIPLFAVGAFLAFTMSQAGMVVHWKRTIAAAPDERSRARARLPLAINALGCAATSVALLVILLTKFTHGAWIVLILITALVGLFLLVRRHYDAVEREIVLQRPLDPAAVEPPLVVVPVGRFSSVFERALRFARTLSRDVIVTHVAIDEQRAEALREQWNRQVHAPLTAAGEPVPAFQVLPSPYRFLHDPLLDYVDTLARENPDRLIAIVIPDFVQTRWWEWLLHNQNEALLKANLLFRRREQIIVISVPWYLGKSRECSTEAFSLDSCPLPASKLTRKRRFRLPAVSRRRQ